MEIWKDVVGYEGLYQVSNFGKIKSYDKWSDMPRGRGKQFYPAKELSICTNDKGYLQVTLYKNRKGLNKTIHILVAKAFIPNPLGKPCVNHKDLNKANPHVDNLEWCTLSENSKHACDNGVMTGAFKTGQNGVEVKCSVTGEIFKTIIEASKYSGVSAKRLAHMVSGRCINKTTIIKVST